MRSKPDFPQPTSRQMKIQEMEDTAPPKALNASGIGSMMAKEEQRSFHLFQKFPIELRLKIWSHALPSHRIIKIKRKPMRETEDEKQVLWGFRVNPSMLHACHESRSVALRASRPSFHAHLQHPVFFTSEMDVLWMQNLDVLDQFFSATKYPPTMEVTTVRALVVDPLRLYSFPADIPLREPHTAIGQAISRFGALEEIIILKSDDSQIAKSEYNVRFGNAEFQNFLERALGGWKNWYAQQSRETWKEERQVEAPRVTIMTEEELEVWVEGDYADDEFDENA